MSSLRVIREDTFDSLRGEFEVLSPHEPLEAMDELATRIRKFILTCHVQKEKPQLEVGRRCASMLNSLSEMRRRVRESAYGN